MSDTQKIVHVASLLASRLCHDLVNPVGALQTGLDVLDEDTDPGMREHAMSLVKESTDKTIALLTFARFSFGSSGGWEGSLDMGEAAELSKKLYDFVKAELIWEAEPGPAPKARGRALMNLVIMAERCVPRAGSTVTVSGSADGYEIRAQGPKAKFSDEFRAALDGKLTDLQAKEAPAYLAWLLAEATGDRIEGDMPSETEIVFRIAPQ